MKPFYSLLLAGMLCNSPFAIAQSQNAVGPNLSPATRLYLERTRGVTDFSQMQPGFAYKKVHDGSLRMGALLKISDANAAAASLEQLGVAVGTKAGLIWTAQIPPQKVAAVSKAAGIAYLELDQAVVQPNMDVARKTTRVDSVHGGYNLPQPYTGKGVLMGIMDFGFDYSNPLFYDTSGTRYRVLGMWEQAATAGIPPAGMSYGREITDTNQLKNGTTDNALQTHGTAVAGMAVGSGIGSSADGKKWRGMAYETDVVLAGVRRDAIGGQWLSGGFSDFVDGIGYLFKWGTTLNKPTVVNVSWGSQSGPHDGSSLFNQAMDGLTGPGKILVMSAGNSGADKVHLQKTFSPADSAVSTFVSFAPKIYQRTWVDVWGEANKSWCAEAVLYRNGQPTSNVARVCLDNTLHNNFIINAAGDTCEVKFINEVSAYNGKPRMVVDLYNRTSDTVQLRFVSTSGTIHMWDEYYFYGYNYQYSSAFVNAGMAGVADGDTAYTVSDMGASQNTLLVGAYTLRTGWKDINGNSWSYPASYAPINNIASFSSRGPMADGRVKPDITAPGLTVATYFSSYDTAYTATGSNSQSVRSKFISPINGRTYYFAEFTGTSAASPAAAGIVALLLQIKPTLTPAEVRNLLSETAIQDVYTGNLGTAGNNRWGHGKINAYSAVKKLLKTVSIPTFANGISGPDVLLFPNPASGAFTLQMEGTKNESLDVVVYDLMGRVVKSTVWQAPAGMSLLPVSVTGIPAGNYLVSVRGAAGVTLLKVALQ